MIPAIAGLLAAALAACSGVPSDSTPVTAPGEAGPAQPALDEAAWPGPVEAEVTLRFGDGGNCVAERAAVLPGGAGIELQVAAEGSRAAYGAQTMVTLPPDAGMALGPDQYVEFEILVAAASDARLLIQLDETRGDANLRGLIVLPAPTRDGWQKLDVNLLRNELSGDPRPRSTIMPDGTPLTRLGFLVDPRAAAGLEAVRLRNVRLYRRDVLANAPVGAADAAGQTALHRAAMKGDAERAAALLARGADVNAKNVELYTPLAHAVIAHDPETVRVLIAHGAEVMAQRRLGFTPLYDAAADGQLEIMRLLMDAGADPTQQTEYGFEPLFTAIHHGHLAAAELLIADPRVDVNRPIAQFMPLHVAAQGDEAGPHLELYHRLIELGARVDMCSAAAAGDRERIEAMLQADPDAARTTTILGGWTPLHDAVRNVRLDVVELLLAHGADPNAISGEIDYRSAPLHWVGTDIMLDEPELKVATLRRLVEAGANLDALDKFGNTPLDRARQQRDAALTRAMLELGARTGAQVKAASGAGGSDR
ncbi:MAG: ankyrin repeat domain-containing protein [Planctomycetes bacterium]|nr:ankyrin repeat domain-containing protein [Planctomycetota bacterium]